MVSWYGRGLFGVGDLSHATVIDYTGLSASVGFDGTAKVTPRPQLRVSAVTEFQGAADTRRGVTMRGTAARFEFASAADWWAGPLMHLDIGHAEFGSHYYLDQSLPDRETMHLCSARLGFDAVTGWKAALRLSAASGAPEYPASARTVPWAVLGHLAASPAYEGVARYLSTQPIKLDPGRISYQGDVGVLKLATAFRRLRAQTGVQGLFSGQIWVVTGVFGRSTYSGSVVATARLTTQTMTAAAAYEGRLRTSYNWSDETAPGRIPVPAWGGTGAPEGGWVDTPSALNGWQDAGPAADDWIETPAGAGSWQDG